MRWGAQPANRESQGGPAFTVAALVADVPAGATGLTLWACRRPECLSPESLAALATGALPLSSLPVRQLAPHWGLRMVATASAPSGTTALLEGSLLAPDDEQPRAPGGPSWDVARSATAGRPDGPWLLAATALAADGSVVVALGGLGQSPGQEHLAAVWLGPADFAAEYEAGVWLQDTLLGLKPLVDWRMGALPGTQDLSVKGVLFTADAPPSDVWPQLRLTPDGAASTPDGVGAPDRWEMTLSYTIRAVAYSDDPALNARALAQLMGTVRELLNTRALREGAFPSGRLFSLAYCTAMEYGQTQDGWDDAAQVTWQCKTIATGWY